jgi:hypothetical protein
MYYLNALIFFSCIGVSCFCFSCGETSTGRPSDEQVKKRTQDTGETEITNSQATTRDTNPANPDQPLNPKKSKGTGAADYPTPDNLKEQITGYWALAGSENATFVLEKYKIFYPDQSATYRYELLSDTLKIFYGDYVGNFRVKMRGLDTLVLKTDEKGSDEDQIYFRFKN